MSRATKLVVDQIIQDLQNRPEDFECDDCVLRDSKTKYDYWVSNGCMRVGIYKPYKMNFGAFQGWRFHDALKKWKAWRMLTYSTA